MADAAVRIHSIDAFVASTRVGAALISLCVTIVASVAVKTRAIVEVQLVNALTIDARVREAFVSF